MMFGGVYTSKHQHLLTGSLSCPSYFYQRKLYFGEDIMVCVSQDDNGVLYSVSFGGFESCTSGNPLAATNNLLWSINKALHTILITVVLAVLQ